MLLKNEVNLLCSSANNGQQVKRYAASMQSLSQQDCIIIKIPRIYTMKEKFCLFISAKFSCAIHQSKTFHPAFGDTKERHTVHMRTMFRRCGLGLPCVFSQPSHTWHKLFSGLLIFPESVLADFPLL